MMHEATALEFADRLIDSKHFNKIYFNLEPDLLFCCEKLDLFVHKLVFAGTHKS